MRAACNLVETLWGRVFCIVFLMELAFLSGADQLVWYDKKSLVVYN
jgi:adenine/guanine phosphoribosyltransferase-like PRPP-binding protein